MVFPVVNIPAVIRQNISAFPTSIRAPLWDFATGEFKMSGEGKIVESTDPSDTFGQLVHVMMIVRRGVYPIYDFEFGTDIYDLVGHNADLVLARINRVIRDSLNNERIVGVTVSVVSQDDHALVLDIRVIDNRGSTIFNQPLVIQG